MRESAEVAPQMTNSAEEQVQVTRFADDMGIIAEPLPGEVPLPMNSTMQHADVRDHSIISYLGRPQVLKTFTFSGEKRGDILADILVPDTLLDINNRMYLNKLDGFTSFRATAVLKLQINSEPFQAGRLLMYSIPVPVLTGARGDWVSRHVSMAQSLHNVQLDIAKQTEVELRVPFVSPYNCYDLTRGRYSWARIKIMVYSKLASIGVTSLQCILWGHFEDVVLGAPTSALSNYKPFAVQQSGKIQPRTGMSPPIKPSAGVVNAVREKEATGLITKISQGAQGFYNGIGETIPALKPVTDVFSGLSKATATGLGGIASGLFSLLGFSKPQLSHSGITILSRPTQYFSNVNGNDHSHVLALDVLNAIDEYPELAGTKLSETSLDFLKKIPQYITNFCYAKSSAYGTPLANWFVSPMNIIPMNSTLKVSQIQPQIANQPTVLNYISSIFEYWSGSIVYTIRFVKTDFHSGRVEISYHPFLFETPNPNRLDYVYRLVVDLRENSEVSFVVPFIAPQQWKKVRDHYSPLGYGKPSPAPLVFPPGSPVVKNEYAPYTTGIVFVRALTPLVCASSIIAETIECLVECRAGDDFRLQCPDKNLYLPTGFYTEVPAAARFPKQQSGVVALPGTQETRTSSIEGFMPPSITGIDQDIHTEDTQRYCAGEQFTNYLSLTRRFGYTERLKLGQKVVPFRDGVYYVRPPYISYGLTTYEKEKGKIVTVGQLHYQSAPTPLTFVSSMFAFYRGGFRIKTYNSDPGVDLTSVQIFPAAGNDNLVGPITQFNYMGACAYEQTSTKRFAEFQIPYYSPTLLTAFWPYRKPSKEVGAQFAQPTFKIAVSGTNLKNGTLHIATAAADDFSLHTFIGVPPCLPTVMMNYFSNGADGVTCINNDSLSVNPTLYLDNGFDDHDFKESGPFLPSMWETSDITTPCWPPPKPKSPQVTLV